MFANALYCDRLQQGKGFLVEDRQYKNKKSTAAVGVPGCRVIQTV